MKITSLNEKQRRWIILMIVMLILIELAALLYFARLLRFNQSSSPVSRLTLLAGGNANTETPIPGGALIPSPLPGEAGADSATATALANLPTPDPWNGKGRVTILVMGLDYGDWASEDRVGPPRSDTMFLFTVDPVSKTAGILSIPRDLWLTIPGIEGEHKINTAHRFGELYDMPGGGPGLAMRTVEKLLGVPINFFAVVDFYAFEKLIDELGGVEVNVPEEIKVDPIGQHNTVVLQPGLQTLDGPTALAYARNRSTEGDEMDRARRQQQVIMAIRDKALNPKNLPLLILRAPTLYSTLSSGIRTNMSLEQAIRLAWLGQEIPEENIQRANIGNNEVLNDVSADGQDIMIPKLDKILDIRDKIFVSATAGPDTSMTKEELVANENSRITIINDTGDPTLGASVANFLKEKGLNVIQVQKGEGTRPLTRIIDQVGDPNTFRYLIDMLHINPSETYLQYDVVPDTDIVIYLGKDWAADNPLP